MDSLTDQSQNQTSNLKNSNQKMSFTNFDILLHESIESLKYGGYVVNTISSVRTKNSPKKSEKKQDVISKKSETQEALNLISRAVEKCIRCELHVERTHAIAGNGVENPLLMIITAAPSREDDLENNIFTGEAGQMLDKWLKAINLSREKDVFLTSLVKCKPVHKDPSKEEITCCNMYLARQVALLKPKCILAVGMTAARTFSAQTEILDFNVLRGEQYLYNGVPVFITYHPQDVIQNFNYKKPVWEDLQNIQKFLGL